MTIDPPKNKILTVIIHVRLWLWILVEYYDELGTPQGRWWHVDDSTIWTMIDLGGELILWVSQVILRKYLCPLFVVTAGTQNYKKKLAKDVEDTFKILVICMLSADSVWINLAKSYCVCKIDASMQRVSASATQQIQAPKPTRYPNDHSRNCLPLWHLSSRDALASFGTLDISLWFESCTKKN